MKLSTAHQNIRLTNIDRLESIAALPQNWNGYGAPPISQAVIEQIHQLFLTLDDADLPDRVVPTSDGGVQIEYEDSDTKYLEIEFGPESIGYLLQFDGFAEEREDASEADVVHLIERSYRTTLER